MATPATKIQQALYGGSLESEAQRYNRKKLEELARVYRKSQMEIQSLLLSGDLTEFKTKQLTAARARIKGILANVDEKSQAWAKSAMPGMYFRGTDVAAEDLLLQGLEPPHLSSAVNTSAVNALVDSFALDALAAENSIFQFADRFIKSSQLSAKMDRGLSEAIIQGINLGENRVNVSRRIVSELKKDLQAGQLVTAGSKKYTPEAYARLVARTRMREAFTQGTLNTASEVGMELAQVSVHENACPICQLRMGKVYALNKAGRDAGFPALDEAPPYHPNCECTLHPVSVDFLKDTGELDRLSELSNNKGIKITGQEDYKAALEGKPLPSNKAPAPGAKNPATAKDPKPGKPVGAKPLPKGRKKPAPRKKPVAAPQAREKAAPLPDPKSALGTNPGLRAKPYESNRALSDKSREFKWIQGGDNVTKEKRDGKTYYVYKREDVVRRKQDIAKNISRRSGIPEGTVAQLISSWAASSNDQNYTMLLAQERAAKKFGGKLSRWQEQQLALIRRKREGALAGRHELSTSMFTPFEDWQSPHKVKMKSGLPYATNEENLDAFLDAMYDNTQENLKAKGIKSLRLWRGTTGQASDIGAIGYSGNAMESWSTHKPIAQRFSNAFGGRVMSIEVPAERLIGSSLTGFGCSNEWEVVILFNDRDVVYSRAAL